MPDKQNTYSAGRHRLARLAAMGVVLIAFLAKSTDAGADTCIVTPGWDAAVTSRADSHSLASAATSLTSGTLSLQSFPQPLEARYRDSRESEGTDLDTYPFVGTLTIVR